MKGKNILILGGVILIGALGVFAYVVRPSAEASASIEAIPLGGELPEVSDPLPTVNASDSENMPVEEPVDEPADTGGEETNDASLDGIVIYTIDQSASNVSFSIDELLRGKPVTAVGITNQVAGQIGIDFENAANIVLGTIQVNARTIQTDQQFRDRAIANQILDTGEFEFITFVPTELIGLPLVVEVGAFYDIQVVGELTIRNFTNLETWSMEITILSEDQISGNGSTIVLRENYDLRIPEVTSVANVSQEVILEIDFIANK